MVLGYVRAGCTFWTCHVGMWGSGLWTLDSVPMRSSFAVHSDTISSPVVVAWKKVEMYTLLVAHQSFSTFMAFLFLLWL